MVCILCDNLIVATVKTRRKHSSSLPHRNTPTSFKTFEDGDKMLKTLRDNATVKPFNWLEIRFLFCFVFKKKKNLF